MSLASQEVIALGAAVAGSLFSVFNLYQKRKAENNVEKILTKRKDTLEQAIHELSEHLSASNEVLTEKDFKELKLIFADLLHLMEKSQRNQILESLEQTSLKGQIDYLNKLLHLSGSKKTVAVEHV